MNTARILIVDDNVDLCRNLRDIFKIEGYTVTIARTGAEAIEVLQTNPFHVTLLDLRLSDTNGIELLPDIHALHANMPVIVITAYASLETAVRALDLGAFAYILKPLDMNEVLITVKRAVETLHLVRQERRLTEQLKALNEAAVSLTAELEPDRVLEGITNLARELVSAKYAAIGVPDDDGRVTTIYTSSTDGTGVLLNDAQKRRLLQALLDSKKPLRLNDVPKVARVSELAEHMPIQSWLGTPIISHGRALGAFFLLDKDADLNGARFTAEDEQVIETLAAHAAVAIENARLFSEVQRLSITDQLTGLYNRRYFSQQLDAEFQRARRYQRPLSLIILDLDHFKQINDRYGHLAGDLVLQEIADLVNSEVRESDTVVRYGGEEFAIILPETGERQAARMAQRICESIRNHLTVTDGGTAIRITASLGVGTVNGETIEDSGEFVRQTDQALYGAKQQGRNRVHVA